MTAYARNPDGKPDPLREGGAIMRLRLIGQMQAWTNSGDRVLPSGRKTRGVLAVVALSAPRPVLRGRLAEMFWSRRPEEQARASLRQEIHRLLEAIEPLGADVLAISRDHLALRPGMVWTDVDDVLRATAADPGGLALFDGDLLEDLDGLDPAFDAWLAGERERIGDRARQLAEQLMRQQVEPEETIAAAQRLLAIDRAHEGAWRALMRAYAARGERGMAIQAYERCRTVLMEQLDAEPSSETALLGQELRAATLPSPTSVASPAEGARPRVMPAATMPRPVGRGGFAESQAMLLAEPRQAVRSDSRPDGRAEPRVRDGRDRRAPTRVGAQVGVLPLRLLGLGSEEAHLSSGLADEITDALSRFRWIGLTSATALARFAAQNDDEDALRRAFDLDFLLDGSVQRAGDQVRVSVRLLDLGRSGQVAWSRRFDRPGADLLVVQDEIAGEVVAQVEPQMLLLESQRFGARPSDDPGAYELTMRALPKMARMEHAAFMQAGELLERAIAVEPDSASARAWSAYWHALLVSQSWAADPAAAAAEAAQLSERAIVLDPQDARALTIAGHVRAFLHRRIREAMTLHDRALRLNPNLAMAWVLSGVTQAYAGELADARRRLLRYKHLSPLDPQGILFDAARVLLALLEREYDEAVTIGRELTELNPDFVSIHRLYLAALGHTGDQAEAARVRARLAELEPDFSIARILSGTALQRLSDRDHVAEGLRRAGTPER